MHLGAIIILIASTSVFYCKVMPRVRSYCPEEEKRIKREKRLNKFRKNRTGDTRLTGELPSQTPSPFCVIPPQSAVPQLAVSHSSTNNGHHHAIPPSCPPSFGQGHRNSTIRDPTGPSRHYPASSGAQNPNHAPPAHASRPGAYNSGLLNVPYSQPHDRYAPMMDPSVPMTNAARRPPVYGHNNSGPHVRCTTGYPMYDCTTNHPGTCGYPNSLG